MSSPEDKDLITRQLSDMARGDAQAVEAILPRIYDDLRGLAGAIYRKSGSGSTLQPTALVHESFMRLVGSHIDWTDRRHFYNVAAQAMRQLLIDHARERQALKRGGELQRVELSEELGFDKTTSGIELIALAEALKELAELDPRQARIVDLRFLAGLSVEETAKVLGVSERTVYLDWRMARSWLSKRLG